VEAFDDAVAYINEHGGVHGVPMRYKDFEDLGKLDAALAYYEEWSAADVPFFVQWSHSAQIEALKPRLDEDKIVAYSNSPTYISLYPTPGYVFGTCPTYPEQFGLFCDWLVKTQPKPWKLAILTWDTEYGRGFWSKEAKDYMEKKGIELVAEEYYPGTCLDVSTQLTRIYNKGGDGVWIYNNSLIYGPATLVKSADALGLLGKIHFAGGQWNLAYDLPIITGQDPAARSGFIAVMNFHNWDDDVPGMRTIREYYYTMHRAEVEHPTLMGYSICWEVALVIKKAFEFAVDKVGWENLDGPAIREGFLAMEKDPMTELNFKASFSSERPAPIYAKISQLNEAGLATAITDWLPVPNLSPETYWTKGPSYLVPEH
jgi:ABC-type branched-subunit amino acid transport system substrate-binding protein